MGKRRARALCLAVAFCASGAALGQARADDVELTARVEALLAAGVEPGAAHATVAALGAEGARALERVFEHQAAPRYVRLRALSVLASFESSEVARYFEALIEAAQTPTASLDELHPARSSLVLRRALEALRPLAGLLDREPALEAVTRCLTNRDPHVRRAAAELLATLAPSSTIDRALGVQLASEPSRMVHSSLERALTSRSARSQAPR
ncbi:MAG: hypothetical protein JWN04_6467 [Myxococcaceae bacterium]|nr:hypothetical protein [Myxococcaceae bacterium]